MLELVKRETYHVFTYVFFMNNIITPLTNNEPPLSRGAILKLSTPTTLRIIVSKCKPHTHNLQSKPTPLSHVLFRMLDI